MARFPGQMRLGLNQTLEYYSLPSNVVHNNDVYKTNERFWAARPLTQGKLEKVGFRWTGAVAR